jgi:hypothetical protein
MKYYLETNSLRQLSSKLENPFIIENAFTSILALIEIASGIRDNKTFQIRRSIIEKFLNSKLLICLNMPETLYLKAFGFEYDDKEIVNGIGRVFKIIVKSNSYNDFQKMIMNSNYSEYYHLIKEYDQNASIIFKNLIIEQIDSARKSTGFRKLIELYKNRWSSTDAAKAQELYDNLIDYFSKNLFSNSMVEDGRTKEEIKKSYDHSIDTFIVISTVYTDQHISSGSTPGLNDFFDLGHLAYLDNVTKIIITDDKLLHRLLIGSFSKMVRTTKSFIIENSI